MHRVNSLPQTHGGNSAASAATLRPSAATSLRPSHAGALLATLSNPNLPRHVSTAVISWALSEAAGREADWRRLSQQLLNRAGIQTALNVLGWKYRGRRGQRGSQFVRVGRDRRQEVVEVVGLDWEVITRLLLFYQTQPS